MTSKILKYWALFAGTHLVQSHGEVRKWQIEQLGSEELYRGAYSAVSLLTFSPIVYHYIKNRNSGGSIFLSKIPQRSYGLNFLLNSLGISLIGLAATKPSPVSIASEMQRKATVEETPIDPRGVERITRHPIFAGLGSIGLAQSLVAVNAPTFAFWIGFPIFYAVGCYHQDLRKSSDPKLQEFFKQTSLLPFMAILTGKNSLHKEELNMTPVLVGTALSAVITISCARRAARFGV